MLPIRRDAVALRRRRLVLTVHYRLVTRGNRAARAQGQHARTDNRWSLIEPSWSGSWNGGPPGWSVRAGLVRCCGLAFGYLPSFTSPIQRGLRAIYLARHAFGHESH